MDSKYFFFWGHSGESLKAKLSNFAHTPFKIKFGAEKSDKVKEIEFSTGEQAFHFLKALLFKDAETAKQILSIDNPKEQKKLGRLVKNFDEQTWNKNKRYIMKKVVGYKLFQNKDIAEFVRNKVAEGYSFVEASPYDRIWGIGYTESEAMENISNWGENLLGSILTDWGLSLNRAYYYGVLDNER